MTSTKTPEMEQTNESPKLPTKPFRKLFTWIKNILRVVLYLPLLLLVIVALLIGTPLGSRITVNLADTLVPDLDISYQSGTLNSKLNLDYLHWSMDGINVEVNELKLNWRPLCLLQKQICVNELVSRKTLVEIDTDQLPESADEREQEEEYIEDNGELRLPFDINLGQAELYHSQVRVNDMHFSANSLSLQANWLASGLRVSELSSQGLIVNIPLQSDEQTEASDKSTDDEWPLMLMPQIEIPMPIFVGNALLFDSQLILGERQDNFAKLQLQGSYVGYNINLDQLLINHDYGNLHLNGQISLKAHYPMSLATEIELEQIKELPLLTKQHIEAKFKGDLSDLTLESTGKGHINFGLNSHLNLAQADIPYSIELSSDHIMWPLQSPSYEAKQLTLSSQGSLLKQSAMLKGQLQTPYHPPLQVDTELSHQEQLLTVSKLNIDSEMGNIQLNGQLGYGDEINWNIELHTQKLQAQQLNLGEDVVIPNTLIDGQLYSQGKISDEHWQVAINQSDIKGVIGDYPLQIQGDLSVNDQYHLNANKLLLNALQSEFALSGKVDERWALKGHLSVADLSLWHPDASGEINLNIDVSGDDENPLISLDSDLNELDFADINLLKAKLTGRYQPLNQHQFNLSLNASDIKQQSLTLTHVNLNLKGDLAGQQLVLHTQGDAKLDTQVNSKFDIDTEELDLTISQLDFDSLLGLVQLDKPVKISWDNKKQQGLLMPFCWQHKNGAICIKDQIELSDTGNTSLTFNGDLGALVDPLLPKEISWYGPADLKSQFTWSAKHKPTANIEFNMAPGDISFQSDKHQVDTRYRKLQLLASLNEKQLQLKTQFESEKMANINSLIQVGITPDKPLSGNIDISKIDLHAFIGLIPQLDTLEGMISSHLTIAGNLEKPQVLGTLTLKDGQLLSTANPTKLDDINIQVGLGGQNANIDGHWLMGEGQANLNGHIDWREQLKGKIDLNGQKLEIIQPPMVILDVSPSLEILFTNNSVDIKGKVDVPSGSIKVVQLPEGGTAESRDVVFNDSFSEQKQQAAPFAVSSKIAITVGDKLTIDGMGLKGKLQGTLDMRQEPFNPPNLYGDIKVVDGSYKFMGQTLKIQTGEVQFIGPIEMPNLNIVAAREIKAEDVTAGVKITGTPLKPVVTLFSSPTMEHAEILSYIIKGTGINNNDEGQNSSLMLGAALTVSNQLGNGQINEISNSATGAIEKLGISNVQLDANDDGKIAISGYLGEDLMVKYGVGVFTPGYEMTIRYYLMSRLYLETVSSAVEQSIDIYYNFDID